MSRTLVAVADNIWMYPADPDGQRVEPNVGVIVTSRGTVLVDAGNGPRHAQQILEALAEIAAPPVTHVIFTHHHWDHVYGAQVYDAPAIAHSACRDVLAERAARPWGYAYIEEEMRRNPGLESMYLAMQRAVEDWHGFRIVLPAITFASRMSLKLDGVGIEIEHVGGFHAADSAVVRVPSAGIVFLGDCFYRPVPVSLFPDGTHDRHLVRRLLDDASLHVFVDGHRPEPRDRDMLARLAEE